MLILDALSEFLKQDQIKTSKDEIRHYGRDWLKIREPKAIAAVFPKTTQEVEKIVKSCRQHHQSLVVSGGRTGLSGGALAHQNELIVSLEKMNHILDFNESDWSVEVEAGVITEDLQNFALSKSSFFPVDFASKGSSQIGGNLATNAGGVHVLRYGNIRNWITGIEVVTGSGDILQLNQGLIKNATGYDLRHLFIGSEGSLGIITKATVKLTRLPKDKSLFLFACSSWEDILQILSRFQKTSSLCAFEAFDQKCLEKVLQKTKNQGPFQKLYPLYVLIEIEAMDPSIDHLVDEVLQDQLAEDGIQAQSSEQSRVIWSYRENISEAISEYQPYKNDISVRISRIPEFIHEFESLIEKNYSDFEVLWFGHVGDGNLHINILKPQSLSSEIFQDQCHRVSGLLFEILQKLGGSISAEHGIGLFKKDFLHYSRSFEEIKIMKQIKKIFDPDAILNPGKIF
jgi:glycolate oxidase subunit GlcD